LIDPRRIVARSDQRKKSALEQTFELKKWQPPE
jgi:hypothetical protein